MEIGSTTTALPVRRPPGSPTGVDRFNDGRLLEPVGNGRPKPGNAAMPCPTGRSWRRHANQMAAGEPGAVQETV